MRQTNDDMMLIIDELGIDVAERLVDMFRGSAVYIPKNMHVWMTHEKIVKEFSAGATVRELAKKYDYSRGRIYTILRESRRQRSVRPAA
jgi:Mor family transcriptional regulator